MRNSIERQLKAVGLSFSQSQGIQCNLGLTAANKLLNCQVHLTFPPLLLSILLKGLGGFLDEPIILRNELFSVVEVLQLEEVFLRKIFEEVDVLSCLHIQNSV